MSMLTEGPVRTRIAREHCGLSVREASRRTGLPQTTIRRLERSWGSGPRTDTVVKLCQGYGVSIDWIFGRGGRHAGIEVTR